MNALNYVLGFFIAAIGAFFGSYVSRKGQNIADKEDIKRLTQTVEGVRAQHAKDLESLAQENRKAIELMGQEQQLRLAALDRRFEAHQQAFTLWRKLFSAWHTDKLTEVVRECQNWWDNNCLYLDAQSREAFIQAVYAAHGHESILKCFDKGLATQEEVKLNGDVIRAAGPAIVQGVALPPIKDFKTEGIL